ncbi:hypothetical protein EJ03DRAFT_123177 [Teratosphaeria nubilosa]|uniref:Zn(2)-C6 fungal-type domain-containing protein n=1 Tax=Teratosphaeria nubilosa TaxID=161662 RepID=A0A6G1L5W5_9PEZI|nr:hypothetical protein EJ03DRAFT_123177 [Teratosphaeria nubilosa]
MAQTRNTTITMTEDGQMRSTIACRVCRKRKTKCGRELPQCNLCGQSGQQCEYPCEVRRPGPKIGSTQVPRKRNASTSVASRPVNKTPRLSVERTSRISPPPPPPPVDVVQPISPAPSLSAPSPSMLSLSFILHPSHDSCSPHHSPPEAETNSESQEDHIEAACLALGVQPCHADDLIDIFFDTFTSFQLFRRQDFRRLLARVPTATQTKALLAPVLAFAIKGCEDAVDGSASEATKLPLGCSSLSTSYLISLARQYIDQATAESEDDPLPLSLLQALILLTHWFLIKGVRGKAWRYLGTCVRSAYELNLHLVDVNKPACSLATDAAAWCQDEERRRAWWAIWEMDAFASVIQRCPGGIDWSQNETFLPAEDDNWAKSEPQRSCRLDSSVTSRWKALADSGNNSPKAWFIVMNSLAKEAQSITTPIGLHKPGKGAGRPMKDAVNRLVTLLNSVHCCSHAIPAGLKFRCQYLHFGLRSPDAASASAARLQHAAIYSIHCITQLARLMIYRYWIFHGAKVPPRSQACAIGAPGGDHRSPGPLGRTDNGVSPLEVSLALDQYLEAADEVYTLVRRSCADHHKHVNPYLANTLWLAGAVHLLYKRLASPSPTDRELISSNFMLLSVTYNNFLDHWQMPKTLQKNLEVVESELDSLGVEQSYANKDQNDILALLGRHHDGSSGTGQMNAERLASGHSLAPDDQSGGVQRDGGNGESGLDYTLVHDCPPNTDSCFSYDWAEHPNNRFPNNLCTSSDAGQIFASDGQQGMVLGLNNQDNICSDLSFSPANAAFTTYIDGMLSGSYMS